MTVLKIFVCLTIFNLGLSRLIENESFSTRSNSRFLSNVKLMKDDFKNIGLTNLTNVINIYLSKNFSKISTNRVKVDDFEKRKFNFHRKNLDNLDNPAANRLRKFYINYRQAYGIRFDANQLKSSLNIRDKNDDNNAANVTISATVEPLIQLETTTAPTVTVEKEYFIGDKDNFTTNTEENSPINSSSSQQISKNDVSTANLTTNSTNLQANHSKDLSTRDGQRFLNLFNVVQFQNMPCSTQNKPLIQLSGTCYHETECNDLGGVFVDECASGFGVCCIFQYRCNAVTNQSVSYFQNPKYPEPNFDRLICTLTIELWPNINQVLIEFIFFELNPPIDGICVEDQFIVAGQSSNMPIPVICGVNTGQHMYIDVDTSLERKLFLSVLTVTAAARAYSIRVTQLQSNVAPQSCLQYYVDQTNFIKTFNYEEDAKFVETRIPSYFNNLNYAICIKRLPDFCVITYSNEVLETEYTFQLINVDEDGTSVIPAGQAGAEIYNCNDDFIAINGIRLCGEKLNDASISEDFSINTPVTDYSAGPIILPVRTNNAVVGRGFKLLYEQKPCVSEN